MTEYRVIGECEVAGAQPGETVSSAVLDAERAYVPGLLAGGHLEEVASPPPAPKKPTAKSSDG